MHHQTTTDGSTPRPADALYAALPPRAPAFVRAPTLVFTLSNPAPTRLELLRGQIAAAQHARAAAARWR